MDPKNAVTQSNYFVDRRSNAYLGGSDRRGRSDISCTRGLRKRGQR